MNNYDETVNFIDEEKINEYLKKAENPDPYVVKEVLEKALQKKGIGLYGTAVLLQNKDPELDEQIFAAAQRVKEELYGNRIVIFAPLYITNECGNECAYCGFCATNTELKRKTLTDEELAEEVRILEDMGHKRLLLVYGEHPKFGADWLAHTVDVVYKTLSEKSGEIRRANINCAPLDVDGFRKLKDAGIGTYQCFQETYHRETYAKMHLGGKKKDYLYRLYALHRAQEAGLDDVACGVLFGLYDYKFEMLALLTHCLELERAFGVGPHTISFPRIEPALGAELSYNPPYPISDHDFKKVVAILRLAVPYTGLILTTRETGEFRKELLKVGVSQISGASRTYPGAYKDALVNKAEAQQFTVADTRDLDSIINDLASSINYIPSWCTACYRTGRTGKHIMDLIKPGEIKNFCHPNALLSFMEYLEDYASPQTKTTGQTLIEKELQALPAGNFKTELTEKLEMIKNGKRDLFY